MKRLFTIITAVILLAVLMSSAAFAEGGDYTLLFSAGEGEGEEFSLTVKDGEECFLPGCSFSAPEGREFDYWDCMGSSYSPEEAFLPSEDMYFTAVYKYITVDTIILSSSDCELKKGAILHVNAQILPSTAADTTVFWTSSDPKTVSVDSSANGVCTIHGNKRGTAVITAASADGGAENSFTVTVIKGNAKRSGIESGKLVFLIAVPAVLILTLAGMWISKKLKLKKLDEKREKIIDKIKKTDRGEG